LLKIVHVVNRPELVLYDTFADEAEMERIRRRMSPSSGSESEQSDENSPDEQESDENSGGEQEDEDDSSKEEDTKTEFQMQLVS
jgi:hypothetical protein